MEQGVHNLARVNLVLYGLLLMAMNLPFGLGLLGYSSFVLFVSLIFVGPKLKTAYQDFSSPRIIMT